MHQILILEDHAMMRKGLSVFFAETGRWQVLGAAQTIEEAKALLSTQEAFKPDIILLDINLENSSGFDIIPWLRERAGASEEKMPAIVVYSAFDDYAHIQAAFNMGAHGYVCKAQSDCELEEALFSVLNGELALNKKLQTKISVVNEMTDRLTRREQELFTLVRQGISNKEIAARMNISVRTVENHIYCIHGKTGFTRDTMRRM